MAVDAISGPNLKPSLKLVADAKAARGFVRQVARLAGAYWSGANKWMVCGQSLALFLLTVLQVALTIWANYWNRALFDALEQRSIPELAIQAGIFVVILLLTMGVTAIHLLVKRWLQLDWRRWVSERLIERWMQDGHHYQLLFTSGEHDNPDGRIAEDIHIATETAIALAHSLVYSLLILASFVDILLSVTGSGAVPGTSVVVPGYMVIFAFVYAGGGAVMGLLLGRSLIGSTNRMQTAEANFRFDLARAREHSEAIALMHGEPLERQQSSRLFDEVKLGWDRQTFAYMWIVSFSSGYGTLLPVFPILIAAPQFIAGTMTLGILMQAAQAFQKLTSALSWPIDNLGEMAKCRASADRVLSLYDDLLKLEAEIAQPGTDRIKISRAEKSTLQFRNLCIANPDGQILLKSFTEEVHRGERVLIAGDPAVTVALFKTVAGLWPWGRGEILLPPHHTLEFMPQRPFLPPLTLAAALSYPLAENKFEVATMQHALECAGMAWLTPRLQQTDTWSRILPLRSQQRLAFARLLLHKPCWIFIEEATDALTPKDEEFLMEMLERELPNTAIITISFHMGLEHLHQRKLVLNRERDETYLSSSSSSSTQGRTLV